MELNIIHLKHRTDRLALLVEQLREQGIESYKLWDGIIDESNTKRGIAQAHQQIVSWARNQNLPSVLIAEDDVRFTANGAFEYFKKNEPATYDLYLGGIIYGDINRENVVQDFSGIHFYKIKKNFYDTFLSIPDHRDIDRSLANKGKFVVCNPLIAIQQNGYSDNQKRNQNYDLYLKSRKLFE